METLGLALGHELDRLPCACIETFVDSLVANEMDTFKHISNLVLLCLLCIEEEEEEEDGTKQEHLTMSKI